MNEIREQLLDRMDTEFGLKGYRDYIDTNFGSALEVLKNKGNIYDLDNMVTLESILGFHVSYDLYHYIDTRCEDYEVCILDLERRDYDLLMRFCEEYTGGNTK